MAFEEGLGNEPSQKDEVNYALSAYELISTTINIWVRKLIQYIVIVGLIAAAAVGVSYVILYTVFGVVGTIGADPLSYLVGIFFESSFNFSLITLSIVFAVVAFILNTIIHGAAIKFTLDEYGGSGGEIGTSFSHSYGRVVTFIVVQLILSFFVAIILTPATLFSAQALEMIDITDPLNPIFPPGSIELLTSAMLIFVVGGGFLVYISVRFAPVLAVVIDTDLSAIDSLKESWRLTSNNFLHVFGSFILLNVAVLILGIIASVVTGFTFLPNEYLLVIDSIVGALLFSSLNFIFTAVLYRDLRARNDSSKLQELMF